MALSIFHQLVGEEALGFMSQILEDRFYFIELKYTVKARIRFLSQWMISNKSGNRKAMAVFVSVAFFRALIL